MPRSWVSMASTIGPSRARASLSSWAMGSSDRLPLVMTSAFPNRCSSRVCSGVYGQHEAQLGQAGGDAGGQLASLGIVPDEQHDRPPGRAQGGLGLGRDDGHGPGGVDVGHHDGEGLVVAGLAPAQLGHRVGVGGVDGQVVAAEALDGQDPALGQQGHRLVEGVVGLGQQAAVGGEQGELGAADRAGDGLGVEPAVGGVGVLGPAVGAHDEAGHGGRLPVVGDRPDDRVAGPAVGAVDERVAVAAVGGVEQLALAVGAGGDVDADRHRRRPLGPAVVDVEPRRARDGQVGDLQRFDRGERRQLVDQPHLEPVQAGQPAPRGRRSRPGCRWPPTR